MSLSKGILTFLKNKGIDVSKLISKTKFLPYRKGGGKRFYSSNEYMVVDVTFKYNNKTIVIREKWTGRKEYWIGEKDASLEYCQTQKRLKERFERITERNSE